MQLYFFRARYVQVAVLLDSSQHLACCRQWKESQ